MNMHIISEAVAAGIMMVLLQSLLSWAVRHHVAGSMEVLTVTFATAFTLHFLLHFQLYTVPAPRGIR